MIGEADITNFGNTLSTGRSRRHLRLPCWRGTSPACRLAGFLEQTESKVQEPCYARVGNAVIETRPLPAGRNNAPIREALQLIRDRLRRHSHSSGEVTDTYLSPPLKSVQEAQTGVVCENLE